MFDPPLRGLDLDHLLEDGFPIVHEKTVKPDEGALLYDLDRLPRDGFFVIGTAARITGAVAEENAVRFTAHTADKVFVHIRLRLPFAPASISASIDNENADLCWRYDTESRTVLLTWRSAGKAAVVTIKK